MRIDRSKRIHFVGIGGIGMSGIALVLLEMGYKVSGSDLEVNNLTRKIEALGADIFEGHHASNLLDDAALAVYSSSISKDNPELIEALERKVPIVHRAEMLGWLFNKRRGIAVTGTHGKTTTASLISVMLENSHLDPTVIVGGEIAQFDGNAKAGNGRYIVAEADESDGSFLNLNPSYAVLTNIEMEHVDHFKRLGDMILAYRSFVNNLKKGGVVFYNFDDRNTKALLTGFRGISKSFGFSKDADIHPVDVKMNGFHTSFKCVFKGSVLGEVRLKIPGVHNVSNALAAILVGLELGKNFDEITDSIKNFSGAKRRFQLRLERDGVMLVEDYAHHPTEIRAVLSACRNWPGRRVIAVFQPHRYTRSKFLSSEFGRCFDGADKLILTDIYAASEKPIRGVSVKTIYDRVRAEGVDDVRIVRKENIAKFLMKVKRPGDMILILGAGDVRKAADELCGRLAAISSDGPLIRKFKKSFKGRLLTNERLLDHTSFKIGGRADLWAQPEDEKDLRRILLFVKKNKMPIFIMGNGSNILAGDEGFRGVVVNLASSFFEKFVIKGTTVHAGAGFSLSKLIRVCCLNGLSGLESLVGIPGSVGGAIYMNAGGYTNPIYGNIGGVVASLRVMDYSGRVKNLKGRAVKFGYRCSNLEPYIILSATLKLKKGRRDILFTSCSRFLELKKEKQALDLPSAGCVFKNPPGSQFTCGQMIDMLGLKGRRAGGAQISAKHANFIVNRNGASCEDVLSLIGLVRKKVRENYNIPLELEIKLL